MIRKLFDISCISDHVQPISKPLSSACRHYLLKSRPSQRWISIGMQSAKSKTAWKLSYATLHWQNSQKPFYIPHGNADSERLFSHIGLNKTKYRNRLGISTLNSRLTVQFNIPQKCYEFKPNTELLKTCKCYEMNTL